MKQIAEIYRLIFEWLGAGKKAIMGAGFLAAGSVVNAILQPPEGLVQGSYILLMTGALFLVNALFSRLTKCNINVLYYVLVFVAIMELGSYLMESVDTDLTGLISVWGPCFLFLWALQYAVLQAAGMEGISKRIVIAFFDSLLGAAAAAAAFFVPVWLTVSL